ncbi:Disintegrin and metalloproteinase domain-containing protein 28 [Halotydeus destructor]|nr:Disintegrin and metalloproteinase domain-containing protein 28 [Halotydeus destructor]
MGLIELPLMTRVNEPFSSRCSLYERQRVKASMMVCGQQVTGFSKQNRTVVEFLFDPVSQTQCARIHGHANHSNHGPRCEETWFEKGELEVKSSSYRLTPPPKNLFLELVLVIDNAMFKAYSSNKTLIMDFVHQLGRVANRVYKELEVQVSIKHVEIWDEKDAIERTDNFTMLLPRFTKYAIETLYPKYQYDAIQLLTGVYYKEDAVGKAYLEKVCSPYSVGIVQFADHDDQRRPQNLFVWTIIHEIGHNLGLQHIDVREVDDGYVSDTCLCDDESGECIMWPQTAYGSFTWSSCSYDRFEELRLDSTYWCLENVPVTSKQPLCGNGVIEMGEECDCDLHDSECKGCCDRDCKLLAGAKCSSGPCCDSCQVVGKKVGKLCRERSNYYCDKDQVCDGTSEFCPEQDFQMDGQECYSSKVHGYCYRGECNSRDDQCRLLFGSYSANCQEAYERNVQGDSAGNCGLLEETTLSCSEEDILCGQLHCFWRPVGSHNTTWLNRKMTQLGNHNHSVAEIFLVQNNYTLECHQVNYMAHGTVDFGLVFDGTKCGDGKWCMNRKCVALNAIDQEPLGTAMRKTFLKPAVMMRDNYVLKQLLSIETGFMVMIILLAVGITVFCVFKKEKDTYVI